MKGRDLLVCSLCSADLKMMLQCISAIESNDLLTKKSALLLWDFSIFNFISSAHGCWSMPKLLL